MAKKYLDDSGMSYFWGKLKAYFQPKLISGTNIKTINNETLLGSGDIEVPSPADYVVEQGTSGIWTYRKWNSGIAECWGTTSVNITSYLGWGNQYYSSPYGTATFPTDLFNNPPSAVNATRRSGAEGSTVIVGITKTGINQLYIVRPNSGQTGTLTFSIYAIGQWK